MFYEIAARWLLIKVCLGLYAYFITVADCPLAHLGSDYQSHIAYHLFRLVAK